MGEWLVPADFSPCNSAGILHGYIRNNQGHTHPSFTCNQIEGTLTELPSETQNPRRRHSSSSPRVNLRSPAIVFSVTGSRGERSIENDEDPHLGNGPVDSTLAVRVFWRHRGDVAAATTTVEPPSEDRTSKARTTAVLPRSPVLGVLPRSPGFRPCHSFSPSVQLQPPLTSHRVRRRSTFRPSFRAPPPS
ncbi:hypothetical protein PIB30_104571 [Stylosanthes scabra]|uniref:Uncharacterized protein n=1 Tax=Stylosanthes scabra TaxID=79078 RepID=A0ABU6TYQ4_9FABA|nr:hypothetical protein [Stylosanthes scabra]